MKNYWIQALLYKCSLNDYRYECGDGYEPWVICGGVVREMIHSTPRYLRITLSTRRLKGGSQWKVIHGRFSDMVENLKTGQRRLTFAEMEGWLKTLDHDTFWVTVEAVNAATYRKGL